MKQLIVITFLLTCVGVYAQKNVTLPLDKRAGKITYSEIIESKKSKQEIYRKANDFVLAKFSSNKNQIVQLSEENGIVMAKGYFYIEEKDKSMMSTCGSKKYAFIYTIKISIKDNKYKYSIFDLLLQYSTKSESSAIHWGYGIVSGSSSEGNLVNEKLEDHYPLSSNKCSKVWNVLFKQIDNGLKEIIQEMKASISASDDW